MPHILCLTIISLGIGFAGDIKGRLYTRVEAHPPDYPHQINWSPFEPLPCTLHALVLCERYANVVGLACVKRPLGYQGPWGFE